MVGSRGKSFPRLPALEIFVAFGANLGGNAEGPAIVVGIHLRVAVPRLSGIFLQFF
jgi:hypothetical protein